MIVYEFLQGSPEWLAHRSSGKFFNASDAPAMMGCSPYKTRTQLLAEYSGVAPAEVDAGTQSRFDEGHRAEALARPLAEAFLGESLFPVVGSLGNLSASFDGITMDDEVAFEHKLLNAELRGILPLEEPRRPPFPKIAFLGLPRMYAVQMEQECMVSGCEWVLFMATKWQGDTLIEKRMCWYRHDPALDADIAAGWAQFAEDLKTFRPAEPAAPPPLGKINATLPALRVEVTGKVSASNLDEFKEVALAAIGGVNRTLVTDQDFADAKEAVKWFADVEARLDAAEQHILAQTGSVDLVLKTIADIRAQSARGRIDLDKLVTQREAAIKAEIVTKARAAYLAHVESLRAETGAWIALSAPDFAAAAKNKRSLASLQDAVDTALAQGKIEADASAKKIRAALTCIAAESVGFETLFPDRASLVDRGLDDLKILVKARIDAHREAENRKLQAAAAASHPVIIGGAGPLPVKAPPAAVAQLPPINTGEIGRRLGFGLSGEFISKTLLVKPCSSGMRATGTWWEESDWPDIKRQLIAYVQGLQ